MKKIAIIIGLALSLNSFSQGETYKYMVAYKDFGTDSLTGLNKMLIVSGFKADNKTACISVFYDIVLINNGRVITTLSSGIYYTDNNTDARNFDALFGGGLGMGIRADISGDLLMIKSFETIEQDLLQK